MAVRFQLRHGTTAEWVAANPVLADGEPGIEYLADGSRKIKIGDGSAAWATLDYVPIRGDDGDDGDDGQDGADGTDGQDAEWTELSQAAYNALSPPDPDVLYIVTS